MDVNGKYSSTSCAYGVNAIMSAPLLKAIAFRMILQSLNFSFVTNS